MAEKGAASKEKQDQKMVPLAELSTYREKARTREQELKAQIRDFEARITSLEDELKVATADVEDDEKLKNVRAYLVEREKKVSREKVDYDKKVASLETREREATIKELVAEFRAKGVEVDAETLRDEESPRLKCLEIYAAHLEQAKAAEEETPASKIYETGAHGVIKKMPKDMDEKEFAEYEKVIKAEALSKR